MEEVKADSHYFISRQRDWSPKVTLQGYLQPSRTDIRISLFNKSLEAY